MTDAHSDPSSSGKVEGAKPRKFKPTIPKRRPATDEKPQLKAEPEDDSSFKDLIQAAQEPANWENAKGKGSARSVQQKAAEVAFGGNATGFATGVRKSSRDGPPPSKVDRKAASPKSLPGTGRPSSGSRLFKASGEMVASQEEARNQELFQPPPDNRPDLEPGHWDPDSYYPTTLPLRHPDDLPPADDDPESSHLPRELIPQEEEENVAEALKLLGMDDSDPQQSILFQLPSILPAAPPERTAEVPDRRRRLLAAEPQAQAPALSLFDLPAGKLGKLLVFKSGKVKLQMGDVLMDVALGSQCRCLQHVVAVNVDAGSAMLVGEIGQRAVVTPDIDQLLRGGGIPKWQRTERGNAKTGEADNMIAKDACPGDKREDSRSGRRGAQRYTVVDDEENDMSS